MNPFSHPSRRDALRMLSSGFGMLALNGIAASQARQLASAALPGRAKRVIFLCMTGAPSHVDTFDHKPMLTKRDGASLSGFRRGAKLMGSPWAFKPGGKSGLMISELLPEIGKQADHLCLLHGMHTDVPAHAQATTDGLHHDGVGDRDEEYRTHRRRAVARHHGSGVQQLSHQHRRLAPRQQQVA